MKKIYFPLLMVFIFFTHPGCKKEEERPATIASLSTAAVSSITSTSALCGGSIVDDGGASITARGVCYGTNPLPTLANNSTINGNGKGTFSSNIMGLSPNTTYYIRSYATNSVGTAYGNNEIIFNTSLALTKVNTIAASSITGYSAVCGVQIVEQGSSVISKGICFSINPNPTINDSTIIATSPLDSFSVSLPYLKSNTTYYAKAFVTTSEGTGYGNEINFTTLVQVLAVGETYKGGIIFYVDDTKTHGLIASLTDQSINAEWGCSGVSITGSSGIGVGDGVQNTQDIVNECSGLSIAAAICSNLNNGGYSDWSLPSNGELELMYQNLYLMNLGNFSTYNYWSSTEVDATTAINFSFKNNTQSTANKNSPHSVRAIRSF